jgi:hypothetical protein
MKIDKGSQLFFGCKIDSKLREALAQAKPGDRRYFEDPESGFLRICTFDEERWIGRVVNSGLTVNDVEDIQRNVISILRRIAPDVRHSPSAVKIFPVNTSDAAAVDAGQVDGAGPGAPSSPGPYIANY